jgi:hypothetical protein
MAACPCRLPGSTSTVTERRFAAGALLIAVACLAVPEAAAQGRGFEADFEDGKKAWKEIEAQLPAYPKDGNLLPFETGGTGGHRFFVDASSISIGADGVVRYTLVVKTRGGAVNVSFEGIRCETREQKYYAVGHPDGKWSRARDPQWRRIEAREVNRHHGILYVDYLCEGRTPARSAAAVVSALKDKFGPTRYD